MHEKKRSRKERCGKEGFNTKELGQKHYEGVLELTVEGEEVNSDYNHKKVLRTKQGRVNSLEKAEIENTKTIAHSSL